MKRQKDKDYKKTKDKKDKKTKRQNDKNTKRQRLKRKFNIVTSGQFCTLAMFVALVCFFVVLVCLLHVLCHCIRDELLL